MLVITFARGARDHPCVACRGDRGDALGDVLAFDICLLGVDRLLAATLGVRGFDDGILCTADYVTNCQAF